MVVVVTAVVQLAHRLGDWREDFFVREREGVRGGRWVWWYWEYLTLVCFLLNVPTTCHVYLWDGSASLPH